MGLKDYLACIFQFLEVPASKIEEMTWKYAKRLGEGERLFFETEDRLHFRSARIFIPFPKSRFIRLTDATFSRTIPVAGYKLKRQTLNGNIHVEKKSAFELFQQQCNGEKV